MGNAPLIDTHCHLTFDRYDDDRADVITRAEEAGLVAIINPAVDVHDAEKICQMAGGIPHLYVAVGVHPNSTANFGEADLARLRQLAEHQKVVAIGEIGVDYYWDRSPAKKQHEALRLQLGLAAECALPVIIHNRDATDDTLALLGEWVRGLPAGHPQRERPGVMHSFSVPEHQLDDVLALGFYVGITGPVTYKKAEELRRIVALVPADRLLIETDGPFLTPHPYRGKRNEPGYVRYVADRIAAVRRTTYEAIAAQTTQNAITLFGLPLNIAPDS